MRQALAEAEIAGPKWDTARSGVRWATVRCLIALQGYSGNAHLEPSWAGPLIRFWIGCLFARDLKD